MWILLSFLSAALAAELWQPSSLLIPDNSTTYGTSDYRTSLSGDGTTVVIGLPSYQNSRGAVWTYRRIDDDDTGTWTPVGPPLLGDVEGSQLGYALALNANGQVLVVGSPWWRESLASQNLPSRAQAYRWVAEASNDDGDGSWQPAGAALLKAPVLDRDDPDFTWYEGTGSGTSVATSEDGTVVAVAAPYWTVYNRTDPDLPVELASGRVVVYQWNDTSNDWDVVGDAILGRQSRHMFGFSIALAANGRRIVIGSPQLSYLVGTTPGNGSALVYELDDTDGLSPQWKQMGASIHGDDEGDAAGYSVAMASDGQRIIVGYPYGGSGLVQVFDWTGDVEWEQTGRDIEPDGSTGYGEGHSVAISGDSRTIAVYSPAQSYNCVTSGLVRLFRLTCNTDGSAEDCDWIQVGDILPGERGRGEARYRGRTLSLQYDGSRLALASSFHYECEWLDWNCPSACDEPDWTGNIRVLDLMNVTETATPTASPTMRTASPTVSSSIGSGSEATASPSLEPGSTDTPTERNTFSPSSIARSNTLEPSDVDSASYSIAQRGPLLAGIVLGLGLLLP
jgi:hypothetical protein